MEILSRTESFFISYVQHNSYSICINSPVTYILDCTQKLWIKWKLALYHARSISSKKLTPNLLFRDPILQIISLTCSIKEWTINYLFLLTDKLIRYHTNLYVFYRNHPIFSWKMWCCPLSTSQNSLIISSVMEYKSWKKLPNKMNLFADHWCLVPARSWSNEENCFAQSKNCSCQSTSYYSACCRC